LNWQQTKSNQLYTSAQRSWNAANSEVSSITSNDSNTVPAKYSTSVLNQDGTPPSPPQESLSPSPPPSNDNKTKNSESATTATSTPDSPSSILPTHSTTNKTTTMSNHNHNIKTNSRLMSESGLPSLPSSHASDPRNLYFYPLHPSIDTTQLLYLVGRFGRVLSARVSSTSPSSSSSSITSTMSSTLSSFSPSHLQHQLQLQQQQQHSSPLSSPSFPPSNFSISPASSLQSSPCNSNPNSPTRSSHLPHLFNSSNSSSSSSVFNYDHGFGFVMYESVDVAAYVARCVNAGEIPGLEGCTCKIADRKQSKHY